MTELQAGGAGTQSREALGRVAPTLLSAMLFLSLFYVPLLGGLFNPFAPLPIIYSFFRFGESAALIAVLFSTLVVTAASDVRTGAFYFLSYGLMALVMARLMARQSGPTKSIAYAALATMAGTAAFFIATEGLPIGAYVEELYKVAQALLGELIATYKKAGMQDEQLDMLVKNSALIAKWIVNLLPGMAVSAYLLVAISNYSAYKFIQSRWKYLQSPDETDMTLWSPPEQTVFVFIAGLGLTLYPVEWSRAAGINLLVVTVLLYSVSGLFILKFWFEKINFPKFLRMFVYILILLQPFVAVAVAAAGLFDLWFDFRKIRSKAGVKEE
jgi:uncharacterized protein YybS (DUF2232 family)